MTEPSEDAPQIDGTDVTVDPADLQSGAATGSTDPDNEITPDDLGGTGGTNAGGAG